MEFMNIKIDEICDEAIKLCPEMVEIIEQIRAIKPATNRVNSASMLRYMRSHDIDLLNRIIKSNMYIVLFYSITYSKKYSIDFQDLFQELYLSLYNIITSLKIDDVYDIRLIHINKTILNYINNDLYKIVIEYRSEYTLDKCPENIINIILHYLYDNDIDNNEYNFYNLYNILKDYLNEYEPENKVNIWSIVEAFYPINSANNFDYTINNVINKYTSDQIADQIREYFKHEYDSKEKNHPYNTHYSKILKRQNIISLLYGFDQFVDYTNFSSFRRGEYSAQYYRMPRSQVAKMYNVADLTIAELEWRERNRLKRHFISLGYSDQDIYDI